jgi:hypothetical protein
MIGKPISERKRLMLFVDLLNEAKQVLPSVCYVGGTHLPSVYGIMYIYDASSASL